jgi:ribosomal protein L31E
MKSKDLQKLVFSKNENGEDSRTIRAEAAIRKVRNCLQKKQMSARKLTIKFKISNTTTRRIFKDDLHLRPYKMKVEPNFIEV